MSSPLESGKAARGAKPPRITRAEFLHEYKAAVARKLKVFTARENIALSREALRTVLAEGRLVLRPDVANARFEGSLVLSHEEFLGLLENEWVKLDHFFIKYEATCRSGSSTSDILRHVIRTPGVG